MVGSDEYFPFGAFKRPIFRRGSDALGNSGCFTWKIREYLPSGSFTWKTRDDFHKKLPGFFWGDQTMEIEHEFPENNSALFGLVIQFILSLVGLLPSDHLQVLCRRVDTMHSSTDVISTGLTQDTFS